MLNIYRHHFVDKQETENNSAGSVDSKLPTGGKHTCTQGKTHGTDLSTQILNMRVRSSMCRGNLACGVSVQRA